MRTLRYLLGFAGTEYLDDVRYGIDPYGPTFTAKKCRVVVAHIQIECMSAPGAGEGLSLTLTVGGQDNLNRYDMALQKSICWHLLVHL